MRWLTILMVMAPAILTEAHVPPWAYQDPDDLSVHDDPNDIFDKWIVRVTKWGDVNEMVHLAQQKIGVNVTNTFEIGPFKAFSITTPRDHKKVLQDLGAVKYIERDHLITAQSYVTQSNAPPGLTTISHRRAPDAEDYVYDETAGDGSTCYVLDTGIYTEHNDFGGRAFHGANFVANSNDTDDNGHGTHVAGIIGGTTYGVAKKTRLVSVKVMNKKGEGSITNALKGLEFAVKDAAEQQARASSLAILAFSTYHSKILNHALRYASREGLFLATAAGNQGKNAEMYSPASTDEACTIAAVGLNNEFPKFTNHGAYVDVFAPGVNILSAGIGAPDATKKLSGTSMAAAHVAGIAAYFMGLGEKRQSPTLMCERIRESATVGAIRGMKVGGRNRIVYNESGL